MGRDCEDGRPYFQFAPAVRAAPRSSSSAHRGRQHAAAKNARRLLAVIRPPLTHFAHSALTAAVGPIAGLLPALQICRAATGFRSSYSFETNRSPDRFKSHQVIATAAVSAAVEVEGWAGCLGVLMSIARHVTDWEG
jgi:hypothetical protein